MHYTKIHKFTHLEIIAVEHKQIPADNFHYLTAVLDILYTPFIHEIHVSSDTVPDVAALLMDACREFDKVVGEWIGSLGLTTLSPVSPPSVDDDEIPF